MINDYGPKVRQGANMTKQEINYLIKFTHNNAQVEVFCRDSNSAYLTYQALKEIHQNVEMWKNEIKLRG